MHIATNELHETLSNLQQKISPTYCYSKVPSESQRPYLLQCSIYDLYLDMKVIES